MSELNSKTLLETVMDCLELHMRTSKDWHYGDPAYESDDVSGLVGLGGLRELIMRQHWMIFRLEHLKEEGGSPTRIEMLEGKMAGMTEAVNAHMLSLLEDMGQACPDLDFGTMMGRMSELSLATYHLREEAKIASGEAAHEPGNVRLARDAECLMEKVGELDTLRMVQGREMLDAIWRAAGNLPG